MHPALHHIARWEGQVDGLHGVQSDPVPELCKDPHQNKGHLMVLEGDRNEQGQQTDRCSGPSVKRDANPCPGHQNLMVKQL